MSTPMVTINNKDYPLSTKLRVAYKIQSQNGHKPYAEIFQNIDTMMLEQQIDILYAAFEVANPDEAKFITRQTFLDHYLDNYDLDFVMTQLKDIISGILGKSFENEAKTQTQMVASVEDIPEGN